MLIEEQDGFSSCMCCGDRSFEIYRGDELMATLGFHHGESLRWSGGWWHGDAQLTEASGDSLCSLLAEHGYVGPLAEHKARKRQIAAYKKHRAACLKHITAEQFDGWLKAYRESDEILDQAAAILSQPAKE